MSAAEGTPPRLRYAPSPTGDPHVGNIRTALWSWLHARRHGGAFIVRIEDTDQARAVPGAEERILESLRWLGIDWDEGPGVDGPHAPYVQSQRLPLYREEVDRLLAAGSAYRCFDTPEQLAAMREEQRARKASPGYDGRCRAIPPAEAEARAEGGEPFVVRFRMPDDGSTAFHDEIRGEIRVENALLDDFVILKSDGFPTYHLAHVVDDHHMQITHVTRGDEWIPSTPRHVRLIEALGWQPPTYVHTPVILGPDGGKLSKRHGARSVLEYAEEGYLPEALLNFLAITGWALDDHTEIFSREELLRHFDIGRLVPNPAVFDTQKLEWMNGLYLRQLDASRLADLFEARLARDLPREAIRPLDRTLVEAIVPLVRERVKLLSELAPMVDFLFTGDIAPPEQETLLGKPYRDRPAEAQHALNACYAALDPLPEWAAEPIEAALRATTEELGERAGSLFMLCRVAVTGRAVTPPLFETMELVGRERSLARLRSAEQTLRY
jgi:glutamyl-tRNA synthetase